MMTILKGMLVTAIVGTLILAGCEKVTPEQRAARAQQEQERAYKRDYEVLELFTKDGCTVYRFRDNGDRHYFTNCSGSVVERHQRTHSNGKTSTTHQWDEEIPTAVN